MNQKSNDLYLLEDHVRGRGDREGSHGEENKYNLSVSHPAASCWTLLQSSTEGLRTESNFIWTVQRAEQRTV